MKALIIVGAIGLVAGIGSGTGVAFVMKPDAVPAADSVAAHDSVSPPDSTVVHHAPAAVVSADSGTTEPARAGVSAPDSHDAPATPATPTSPHAAAAATPDSGHAVVAETENAPADSLQGTRLRRLSRIFAAMTPRDAAKVLQQLDDADVVSIVGSLTEKQAAAVLMAMAPERAAIISRGTLRPKRERTP
jgi:hypothetical protein